MCNKRCNERLQLEITATVVAAMAAAPPSPLPECSFIGYYYCGHDLVPLALWSVSMSS